MNRCEIRKELIGIGKSSNGMRQICCSKKVRMVHVYLKSTCAASGVVTTIFVPPPEAEGLDEEASSIILKRAKVG